MEVHEQAHSAWSDTIRGLVVDIETASRYMPIRPREHTNEHTGTKPIDDAESKGNSVWARGRQLSRRWGYSPRLTLA